LNSARSTPMPPYANKRPIARALLTVGVTEPLKLISYYCLNHSSWPLNNNIEVTCRLCRVIPGKSLTSQDRHLYNKLTRRRVQR
jgi:hypothetical protein